MANLFTGNLGLDRSHSQSKLEKRERVSFFPVFFLGRTSRKDTFKEFETAIKLAPGEPVFI